MRELDEIDQQILRALQHDGRLTSQALARQVGLSARACLDRVRRLERERYIEGYRAIKNAGHEILPKDNVEFEGAAYHKTCLRFFKLMSATSLRKICASDHAMNAVDEMSALNRDLKAFFDENGAKYSVWQELEQEVAKYLK